MKINIGINENVLSSHGNIVYKIAFLYSHKIKQKITKWKCIFFMWKHMTWLWFAIYLCEWEALQATSGNAMKKLLVTSLRTID